MVRGPKPKAIRLHIEEGTYKPSRHGDRSAPGPEAKLPPRPAGLKGEARQFWDRHVVPLESLGILTKVDLPLLEALCETFALYRAALKEAKRYPLMQDARMAWKTYAELFNRQIAECGLTPVARARLKIGGGEKQAAVSARQRGVS
jgi:P27 family predicted phage terminase small subunit